MTRPRIIVAVIVVAIASAAAVAVPTICVLSTLVALNLLLGKGENIPFSTYPMFSKPGTTTWTLRFEGPDGEPFRIGTMGINPQLAKKRFGTEYFAAALRGVTEVDEARRAAAGVLGADIEQHPRFERAMGARPISIVFVEYSLESGRLVSLRTPLLTVSPR